MHDPIKKALLLHALTVSFMASSALADTVLKTETFAASPGDYWTNSSLEDSHELLWTSGSTPSSNTGPSSGASGSNDAYYYFETSSGYAYTAGNNAILTSPMLASWTHNIEFSTHVYGNDVGSISMQALQQVSSGVWDWVTKWQVSGQQQTSSSDAWDTHFVDLSNEMTERFRFVVTAAGGWQGDIAIDNITIYKAGSEQNAPQIKSEPLFYELMRDQDFIVDLDDIIQSDVAYTVAMNSAPSWVQLTSENQLTTVPESMQLGSHTVEISATNEYGTNTFTVDIDVLNRTTPAYQNGTYFEGVDEPFWNLNGGSSVVAWRTTQGHTPSSNTGPAASPGLDTYVYLETSSGAAYSSGDTSIIESEVFAFQNMSVEFDYHMYGSDTGWLSLDALVDGVWITDIWKVTGQQHSSTTDSWTSISIGLHEYGAISQLRLRAVAAGGYMGDIAIDNIVVLGDTPTLVDTDGDGVTDSEDTFPSDPNEWSDIDFDGIGDNSDTDDDNDGYSDIVDAFPADPNEWVDTDNDGIGNNADSDDDNDNVNDSLDAFPLDISEWRDTDLDGIGNNADTDDDNDGVADQEDVFPLDPAEWLDTDLDGIGNNADEDDDNDGVHDNDDFDPLDPNVTEAPLDYVPAFEFQNLQASYYEGLTPLFSEPVNLIGLTGMMHPGLANSDLAQLRVEWKGELVINERRTYYAEGTSDGSINRLLIDGVQYDPYNPITLDPGHYSFLVDVQSGDAYFEYQFTLRSEQPPLSEFEVESQLQYLFTQQTAVSYVASSIPQNEFGEINVTFEPTKYPVIAFLSSLDVVHWTIDIPPEVTVSAIVVDNEMARSYWTINADVPVYEYSKLNAEVQQLVDDGVLIESILQTRPHLYYGDEEVLGTESLNDLLTIERCEYFCGLDPSEPLDTDRDGIFNDTDPDDDNDGYEDTVDAFPLDDSEWTDIDGDGIGNNADLDDDGDSIEDRRDGFPSDPTEAFDTDNDGIGNVADRDDDNDGVDDIYDAKSLDPSVTSDTDQDGIDDSVDSVADPLQVTIDGVDGQYVLERFTYDIFANDFHMTQEKVKGINAEFSWSELYDIYSENYEAHWATQIDSGPSPQRASLMFSGSWYDAELIVNGQIVEGWSNTSSKTITVQLNAGVNTVEVHFWSNWHTTDFAVDFR